MTGVKISGERGRWELCDFPPPSDLIPIGHGMKQEPITQQSLGLQKPLGWRPRDSRLPRWELCNFSMGLGSCYNIGLQQETSTRQAFLHLILDIAVIVTSLK